jgi:phosphohistidine phosphatase
MRHAKAERDGPSDVERTLADRGRDDAVALGRWLVGAGVVPDLALVSAARRTAETWEQVCRGAGWDLDPELDPGLYAADVETALDLVRLLDDDLGTVVVLGHNPTMASLAHTVDDGEGDLEATNAMTVDTFPTSATAVFTVACSWADLGPGRASLAAYHVGRA